MIYTCLLTLERTEFGDLPTAPRNLGGAVVTAAMTAIPESHPDQYKACQEWLAAVPGDREQGWLRRYAEILVQDGTVNR